MIPLRPLAVTGLMSCGLVLATFAAAPGVARAETFHTCTGFIDSLPASISRQGVWCLRADLATSISSGPVIGIHANNVTIDCNGFKIGGQSAGAGATTIGIDAPNHANAVVRNCTIRGFMYGVNLTGVGGGHQVEDNRFDGNTYIGVTVGGDGSVVRRNQVLDTGGSTVQYNGALGIYTNGSVDILDNTVSAVHTDATQGAGSAYGIGTINNAGGSVAGNRVRGLVSAGTGEAAALYNYLPQSLVLSGNTLVDPGNPNSIGVLCLGGSAYAKDNVIIGFANPVANCTDLGNSP